LHARTDGTENGFCWRQPTPRVFFTRHAAENAQQEHKQVDEVQVQLQGTNNGQPSRGGFVLCLLNQALDLLGIVRRQSDEDCDAAVGEQPVHRIRCSSAHVCFYNRDDSNAESRGTGFAAI
jgi:hypothetical protein